MDILRCNPHPGLPPEGEGREIGMDYRKSAESAEDFFFILHLLPLPTPNS